MLVIRFNHTLQAWGVLRGTEFVALFACLKKAVDFYNAELLRS